MFSALSAAIWWALKQHLTVGGDCHSLVTLQLLTQLFIIFQQKIELIELSIRHSIRRWAAERLPDCKNLLKDDLRSDDTSVKSVRSRAAAQSENLSKDAKSLTSVNLSEDLVPLVRRFS